MAIRIVTGKPGSGKTYYAVRHLLKNYYKFDKGKKSYVKTTDSVIISNIKELRLPHIRLKAALKKTGLSFDKFFTVEKQKKFFPNKKVVYLIDEAQSLFHKRFYDKDTFFYFEYHRHLGHDIYLMTQAQSLLPKSIVDLAEYVIHGQPRSVSAFGELKYQIFVSGEMVDRKLIKTTKTVTSLYKSASFEETEKVKNPYMKYIGVMLLLVVAMALGFNHLFIKKISKNRKKLDQVTEKVINHQNNRQKQQIPKEIIKAKPDTIDQFIKNNLDNPKFTVQNVSTVINHKTVMIYDPVTNQLFPSRYYPHDHFVTMLGGNFRVFALLPKSFERPPIQAPVTSNGGAGIGGVEGE